MMIFLKKYRFTIILMLVLFALTFWLIPEQEKLYLKLDYGLLNERAFTILIWTLSIVALILLTLGLRGVKSLRQVGNVFIGIVALLIPLFFILSPIILSSFLLLNRINAGTTIEKQYTAAYFVDTTIRIPLVYDFDAQKSFRADNVKNVDKLFTLKTGDTLTMNFNEGLLGFPFNPALK